jgi:hypothetical protein
LLAIVRVEMALDKGRETSPGVIWWRPAHTFSVGPSPAFKSTNGIRGDDLASEVISGTAVNGHRFHRSARSTAPSCSKIPEESDVELVLQL